MGQNFSKLSILSSHFKPPLSPIAPKNLVNERPPLDHLPSASSPEGEDEQQNPYQRPPREIEEEQELEEQVVKNTTEEEEEEEEEEVNFTNPPSQSKCAPKPGCGSVKHLWSEDDEIAISEGMIEYHSHKGADPYSDISGFHEFIKNSLCADASKSKFVDKVKKLKEKFNKNVEKGERAVFSKPHDLECFELSKKIWGGGSEKKRKGVDGNVLRRSKRARKTVELGSKKKRKGVDGNGLRWSKRARKTVELDNNEPGYSWAMNPCLKQLTLPFDDLLLSEPVKSFIMQNTRMIGRVDAEELEKQWKDLLVDEVGKYLKRVELVRKRTELMLDAIKASRD